MPIQCLDQALCGICRENTHRAKMFSSHEILPTSKFSQEGFKKVKLYHTMLRTNHYIQHSILKFALVWTDHRFHFIKFHFITVPNSWRTLCYVLGITKNHALRQLFS